MVTAGDVVPTCGPALGSRVSSIVRKGLPALGRMRAAAPTAGPPIGRPCEGAGDGGAAALFLVQLYARNRVTGTKMTPATIPATIPVTVPVDGELGDELGCEDTEDAGTEGPGEADVAATLPMATVLILGAPLLPVLVTAMRVVPTVRAATV